MVSVLFGIGLLAVSALGQPPAGPNQPAKRKDEKKANPVEALIAAALANDPDVRMAQAKLQLADAELAKARQAVAVKVITLSGAIEEQKRQVASAEDRVAWAARMVEKGFTSKPQLLSDRQALESAKAKLAQLETELKLLIGGGPLGRNGGPAGPGMGMAMDSFPGMHPGDPYATRPDIPVKIRFRVFDSATGPIADRLRAALDKPVKLGAKDAKVTFEQAMEVFKKEAGLDIPIRESTAGTGLSLQGERTTIQSGGESLPVGAWFQLFQDFNGGVFHVRDYGLLYTSKEAAPPDALTLTQFWKQQPAK
jgi:hypothetical protein